MAAPPKDLVLITGATGYLGHLVLIEALKAGYPVRLAVRTESKLRRLLDGTTVKSLLGDNLHQRLSWTIIPDMAAPGAYDEAVKGVKYIIHVASPVPTFGSANPPNPADYRSYFVEPALAGDMGMLRSAAREPSVKRVVLTSSVVAITPFEYYMGQGKPTDRVFTSADRISFAPGPWSSEFEAYSAGKAEALNAAERFVAEETPGFDLVPVIPGWIFGRDELVTNAAGLKEGSTNSVLLALLLGAKSDVPKNGNMVLGSDAAKVHVRVLNPEVKGNRAFLASVNATWQDAVEVLREGYSDAVKAGKLSLDGEQGTLNIMTSATETEKALGFKFEALEPMVRELADQWLELSA